MKFPPLSHLALLAIILATPLLSHSSATAAEPGKILTALSLPNDPKILADFQAVYTATAAVQTEAQAATSMAVVRKFELKHIGGNRLLARIEFDQVPPVEETARYHIYLDTDNNLETGRQDANAKGIDLLATVIGSHRNVGLAFYKKELTSENSSSSAVFDGKILYITIDTPLPATGESIPLAGWVLSQRFTPPQSSSSPAAARFSVPRGNLTVAPLAQGKEATVL